MIAVTLSLVIGLKSGLQLNHCGEKIINKLMAY